MIQRNKPLARALLYGLSLLLAVGMYVWYEQARSVPFSVDLSWMKSPDEFLEFQEVRLLQAYLRIDTSEPEGSEIEGAEWLAAQLREAGAEVTIERIGARNANLWAIVEGKDPNNALVLQNHIDVNPIYRPDDWRHPPFGGVIEPPWIFGRGAFDMKSLTIAQLMAFRALLERGETPEKTVIFLATGDEETGSHLGARWVLREHPELVARFGTVLTEGGAVEAVDTGRVKYWGTSFAQRRMVIVEACHHDPARLEMLKEDLEYHASYVQASPTRLTHESALFLPIYGPTRDFVGYRELLARPERLLEARPLLPMPKYVQSLVRNEATPYVIRPAPGGGWQLRIGVMLLPGVSLEEGLAEVLPEALVADVALSIDTPGGSFVASSDVDHPVYQGIARFMEEIRPDVVHGPLFVPWVATDARFFRAAGIPTFGFWPFAMLTVDTMSITSVNERIPLVPYIRGVEMYTRLVEALAFDPVPEDAVAQSGAWPRASTQRERTLDAVRTAASR
ncbi:MAG: M20/M25/M40 family metallo-hydrolase [Acidobacteriota bacterium]